MLTLDTGQIARQQQITRAREQRHLARERLRENVRSKERTVASDGGLITTSLDRQWGTPMTSVELFQRLQRLNPNLIYEVTHTNERLAGIYRMRETVDDTGAVRLQKVLVCGMERGYMPERSVRVPRMERVATEDGFQMVPQFDHEIRGWRTVLARLLHERLITLAQIEAAFPLADGHSANWQKLTT